MTSLQSAAAVDPKPSQADAPTAAESNFVEPSAPTSAAEGVTPDTSGWFTRDESAAFLGVSPQTIKNYERKGRLRPVRVTRRGGKSRVYEVVLHDPKLLTEIRQETLRVRRDVKRELTSEVQSWLTREDAASHLAVSIQTLKNYEQAGKLHPQRTPRPDSRGHERIVVVYDMKELNQLPRGRGMPTSRDPREINVRAYELFDAGKSVREVVIELRESSDAVRVLYDKWKDDDGIEIVVTKNAREELEKLVGPFKDVTELVDRVKERLVDQVKERKPSGKGREKTA